MRHHMAGIGYGIFADSIYLEGNINIKGINGMKMFKKIIPPEKHIVELYDQWRLELERRFQLTKDLLEKRGEEMENNKNK